MVNLHLSARQYLIAVTAAIACFIPPFIGEATNIALPNMLAALGYVPGPEYGSLFGWILTIYLLTSTIFLIPAARLADKFNKKIFFCIGVLLLGIGSLGIALSTSGGMVMFMRAIEGIGNALMFGTAVAMVTSAVEVKLRGTAIGIAMTGVFMGQLAGPLLSGLLTDVFGWSSVYFIIAPIALLSLLIAVPFVPKDKPTDSGRYDWVGAVLFIIGMTLVIYGIAKQPNFEAMILLIIGAVLMAVFFWYETKCKNPLVPVGLILHNKNFTLNNGANLLYYVAIYAMGSLVSMYMSNLWGFDALCRAIVVTTQGLILVLFTVVAGKFYDHLLPRWTLIIGALMAAGGIIGALLMGQASADSLWIAGAMICASFAAFGIGSVLLGVMDRIVKNAPPKYSTITGLVIITLGMFVLLSCTAEVDVWRIIAVQALFGLGIAIFVTPNSTAIMNSVTEEEYGMASGTLSTARMLGMAISIGVMSILKNVFDFNSEFMQILDGTIAAAIVFLAVAMIFSWIGGGSQKS